MEESDDVSVALKLEVYPNRDSTVFMHRFGMMDCETFVRGTFRFKGFSYVISAFHDIGLTSDNPVPPQVNGLRTLASSLFKKTQE